jgi:hypothetical protein
VTARCWTRPPGGPTTAPSPNPNALEVYQWTNAVFNGLVILDSMWAISDRAGYPASANAPVRATR